MAHRAFELHSPFEPQGDQPAAIEALVEGLENGLAAQVLLGATGTGKTFSIANVIERLQRPTLVLAPNKTLAAQLYGEFKELFPTNAVSYFVSYYDYYQPEAYVPSSDTYIEKDAIVNDAIDRMRHAATKSVLERRDVIVVASVSCIYGIGDKTTYKGMLIQLEQGKTYLRDRLLRQLVDIQYARNDYDFHRGTFRVRGDVIEIFPAYEEDEAIRLEFWGDDLEVIARIDPLRGRIIETIPAVAIFPGSHYVTPADQLRKAIIAVQEELGETLREMRASDRLLEAQRLEQRTLYDIEMMEQVGFCNGIENYSRHLTGSNPGDPPPVLLDYFPEDFLVVVDESHVAVPQVGGMYRGDRARKTTLVDFGFRLPSALDNRPLRFNEFEERCGQVVYMSATPGDYEMQQADGAVIEQIIRPTGLIDPVVEVRPVSGQVDDVISEARIVIARGERVLITTLTKRMSEDLTEYLQELGIKVRYLHSEVDTLERIQLIEALREGVYDVLVGINLLREGLDIPEVSLVCILDADKEGFLRSWRSLVQTIGRAARNVEGRVIMYADKITRSMEAALDETNRRRDKQIAHNLAHDITPQTIKRSSRSGPSAVEYEDRKERETKVSLELAKLDEKEVGTLIVKLRKQMLEAAKSLDFERAAEYRDRIRTYEKVLLGVDVG